MRIVTAKFSSKLLFLFFVLALSASIFTSEASASNLDIATTSIEKAEDALVSAYQSVLEAERVGANVSSLLVRLSDAGELLAKARVAFRLGDFDEADHFAGICVEICESVRNEADELRVEAYGLRVFGSWLTMAGSIVGVVAVGFGSFWGWRVFKRRYIRRVLRMKPEVAKDES